ncbi:von Willebrand factor type A domain protein [Verrucomicrobiia bacterium DG1235]|nr:von Willebrand factor type A domain protein [Verrucomicrobiae bacterium DG1235]
MNKNKLGTIAAIGVVAVLMILKDSNENPPPQSPVPSSQSRKAVVTNLIPDGPWPPAIQEANVLMEADPVLTNYYVIFDASGSMNELVAQQLPKIEAGKQALVTFANNLPEDANLGLLTFDPVRELLPLGRGNRQAFIGSVSQIRAKGRTPLVESIVTGYRVLTEQAQRQSGYGRYVLVIVTDGASSDGNPAGVAMEVTRESPIEVQTIGFGVADHALNLPGVTQYVTASSPKALIDALNQVIASESESFIDPSDFQN